MALQHQTLVSELFCFLTGHVIQCMLLARFCLLCEEDMVLGSWSFHGWLVFSWLQHSSCQSRIRISKDALATYMYIVKHDCARLVLRTQCVFTSGLRLGTVCCGSTDTVAPSVLQYYVPA